MIRFIVCLFLFPVASVSLAQKPDDFKGYWSGEFNFVGSKFQLGLDFNVDRSGELKGWIVSETQGNIGNSIDLVETDSKKISFKVEKWNLEFDGELAENGDSIDGKVTQNSISSEVSFKRVEESRPEHIETWRGLLDVGQKKLDFQIRLFKSDSGELSGRLDSLSEGGISFPLEMDVSESNFNFELKLTGAVYEGEFDTDKNLVTGKWNQRGGAFDLNLEKKDVAETVYEAAEDVSKKVLKRPQTPKAPFPYESEDVTFENKSAGIELAGTLTYPKTGGPFPVAVMISGSGPQDRDETIHGHKPFLVIADHLARNGIAVLRFDDRGIGQSEGDFGQATSKDFASDALAAVEYLASRKEIDADHIGLIGHSEGGIVAPMTTVSTDKVSFIVLLASPGVTGADILRTQLPASFFLAGGTKDKVEALNRSVNAVIDAYEEFPERIPSERFDQIFGEFETAVEDGNKVEKAYPAAIRKTLAALDSKWVRFFMIHDPAPVLEKVKCPVLAVNGEKDCQVDSSINLSAIKNALERGGNDDYEVKELKGLNHLFQNCTTGSLAEYPLIEETFAPSVLEIVSEWIKSKTK